jgi:hypothetical protein
MDPYAPQPQNTLQPPPHNPYEFILNPQQPHRPRRLGLGGGSFGMLIGMIVGGALLLMLVVGVAVTLLAGNKANTTDFVGLSQSQQELIRVSHQGATDAVQQTTKNLAITAEYGLQTQQQQVLKYLATHGKDVGKKEIVLKQNAQTDLQFKTAKATSTFDLVYSQTMQNQLTAYANTLKELFSKTTKTTERELLGKYYEQTQLLISQIPYTQESIRAAEQ